MWALGKGENVWWLSRDLELGLEGRGGVEGLLMEVRGMQTCEPGLGDTFKGQSASG